MNRNTFVVNLINRKEQVNTFYREKKRIVDPVFKGILTLIVILATLKLFPYGGVSNHIWIVLAVSILQAFLPISFLYYFASAFILCNLWKVGIDVFTAFFLFLFLCLIAYFRIDDHYLHIAAIVPVLFFWQLGFVVPAVCAAAIGMEALFPVAVGVFIYYFSVCLQESMAVLAGNEVTGLGKILQNVAFQMANNPKFLLMMIALAVTIIVTSLLYRIFHERAWIAACCLGNATMAFLLLWGHMSYDVAFSVWHVLLEMVLGILLCVAVEFFKGIGDTTRIEKTIFEDEEYIYYVKAVPKLKMSQSAPNIKNMNEALQEEAEEETDDDPELEDTVETPDDVIFEQEIRASFEMGDETDE